MKARGMQWLLPVAAIAALLLMVAWMAGSFDTRVPPARAAPASAAPEDAVAVVERRLALFEAVPATVEAKEATMISSRLLARIERVMVRAGDTVQEGQVLVELESDDLATRVSQAQANVQSVRARLTEARQALERATDLSRRGLLARADLDRARANHDALVASLASAEQALKEADTALGFARIRAPIGGRIVDRLAEPGDTVQAGTPLLALYNPLSLRVEANVRETLALALEPGQTLKVTIPSLNSERVAVIEELVPAGNTGSRSLLVKCRLEHGSSLLPGLYARLQVPAGEATALLIPAERVAQVGQLDIVWVATDQGIQRRYVRIGRALADGMVEVVSGLATGEKVIPIQGI
ncbi:MAG: efflux RND transporter periplasmic adaptor subunit [Halioglobus sp.]|nr:efflux RND transporter periplasmic adaptor subunit [Halioglobus sp.]